MKTVKIQISKKKLSFGMLGSSLFIIGGLWMIFDVSSFSDRQNPYVIQGIGIASVFIFSFLLFMFIRRIMSSRAGLLIDEKGITDHSSEISVGLIEWEDITGIRKRELMGSKVLLIDVRDPQKYISRSEGKIQRNLLSSNLSSFRTPISISSNSLQIRFHELEMLCQEQLKAYWDSQP